MRPPSGSLAKAATDRSIPPLLWTSNGRHGDAKRWRDGLGRAQECDVDRGVRADQHRHPRRVGRGLLEQSEPRGADRHLEALEARYIAARSRKTGHKSAIDWIADLDKNDWDRSGQPVNLAQGWSGGNHDRIWR